MTSLNIKKKEIVKTVKKNEYFGHTNKLFGICADEDMSVREKAVSFKRKIKEKNKQIKECNDRSHEEEEDSAAAVDKDLLNDTDEEEDSEDGDKNEDEIPVVNIIKLVTPNLYL